MFCMIDNLESVGNQNQAKKEFLKSIQAAKESIKEEALTKPSEKINNPLENAYKKIFVQIIQKHKYTPEQAEALIGHTLMILQAKALGAEAEQNIEKTMKEYSCSRDEALVLVASAIVLKAQTQEIKLEKKLKTKIDYEKDFDTTVKYIDQCQTVSKELGNSKKKASKKTKKSEKDSSFSWENKAFSLLVAAVPAAIGLLGRFIFENKTSNQNQTLILAQNPILTGMWKISVDEGSVNSALSDLKRAKAQIASFNVKIKPQQERLSNIENLLESNRTLEYRSGEAFQYPSIKTAVSPITEITLLHTKQGFIDRIFGAISDSLIKDDSQLRIKNLLLNEYRETLLKVFEQKD